MNITMDGEDLYLVLGVDRGADKKTVRAAYLRLAKLHHPDRGGTEKRFQQIQEAYRVLSDAEERAVYDRAGDRSSWVAQRSTEDDHFAEHLRKQREFANQFADAQAQKKPFSNYNIDEWERAHGLGKYASDQRFTPENLRDFYVAMNMAQEKENRKKNEQNMSKHQAFYYRQQQRDRIEKIRELWEKEHGKRSMHTSARLAADRSCGSFSSFQSPALNTTQEAGGQQLQHRGSARASNLTNKSSFMRGLQYFLKRVR